FQATLVAALQQRGWELEYARLRLRWMHGIVGEGLHFKPTHAGGGPELFFDEVDFRLNRKDLEIFTITPETLSLRRGRCIWLLSGADGRRRDLSLEKVEGILRYREPDQYQLDPLTGEFHGVTIRIEASLTNASHLASIEWPQRARMPDAPRGASTTEFLHRLAEGLERCTLGSKSRIALRLQGDVRQTNSFSTTAEIDVPWVQSPWLNGTNVAFSVQISPPGSVQNPFELRWTLAGVSCETPWGGADRLNFGGTLRQRVRDPFPSSGNWVLETARARMPDVEWGALSLRTSFRGMTNLPGQIEVEWGAHAAGLQSREWSGEVERAEGRLSLMVSDWVPLGGQVEVESSRVEGPGMAVFRSAVKVGFENSPTNRFWVSGKTSEGVETLLLQRPVFPKLEFVKIDVQASTDWIQTRGVLATNTSLKAEWRAPEFELQSLRTEFHKGRADLSLQLDTSSRRLVATLTNSTDIHLLSPFFKTNTRRWLAQYQFKDLPSVQAKAELQLPPWERLLPSADRTLAQRIQEVHWDQAVMPSFRLRGEIRAQRGGFRGVEFDSATATIIGSNQLWRLPDIHAVRPEGVLDLDHESDEATRDYVFRVKSTIDPKAIRPLLPESAHDDLALFDFGTPPLIEGEVRGRWRSPELLTVDARFAATNMSFRGETASTVEVPRLVYSNRLFRGWDLSVTRPEGSGRVGELWYQLDDKMVRVTNAATTLDLAPVCRAIGPQVARTMSEYEFRAPPGVRMSGLIDTLKARAENDLHFEVAATNFAWKVFQLGRLDASVHWVKDRLDLRDVRGDFYGGEIHGGADFDFAPDPGSMFRFDLAARGVDLSLLMKDISSKSNKLEGQLDCDLSIADANTNDKFTWNGHGSGHLTDGLLWDIPVFAGISPALNALAPGLGNSRARHGRGTFIITNGVIFTEDLDIRATGMRMKSSGTVDFDKRVQARMEAELLRDTPAVGFLLSKLFWPVSKLFEFKITGTLDKPKTDQLYMVPRILLAPLHPIRTLKGIFGGRERDETESSPEATVPEAEKK
ncbi:MAG: hypothetical protein FJ405_14235, partial [Verrucomicrobia bacterium]|nr:hypothetical protein [Verrucomicrobiota bacterium]